MTEQCEPDRHRVDGFAQSRDEHEVAARLRHLLAVVADHRLMHERVGERPLAGHYRSLGGSELVVRKDKIGSAALHVDDRSEMAQCDGGALDVPARSTGAERRVPRRLTRAHPLPEQAVEWVLLAGPLRVAAAFA